MKYVFGPVASRRLGRSLGVDLVPPKTCSHDCIYCEAGATTRLTLDCMEYVPTAAVAAELRSVLSLAPEIDCVTFSGAGEPTLHSGIGDLIHLIKTEFPRYRCCVLTNAAGFSDPAVRRRVAEADLVIPSLDATCEEEFQAVNRPVPGLSFAVFLEGLRAFTREAQGTVILEYFIIPGVNDTDDSIARLTEILGSMHAEKLQLNTLDRPGVVHGLKPASSEVILRFIRALAPVLPVEAVGAFRYNAGVSSAVETARRDLELRLMELGLRRPLTVADGALALDCAPETVDEYLKHLAASGAMTATEGERGTFYSTNDRKR